MICVLAANLFVLLSLLPPPPPLQSFSLCSALHHGIQTLPQHQIPVMEAPHSWKTQIARHMTPYYRETYNSEVILFKGTSHEIWEWMLLFCPDVQMKVLPKEAACRRQLPSPVVANGSSFLQLVHMVDHQFKRPTEQFKHTDITQTWTN